MIVLDTNVLSELVRDQPDASVTTWLDSLPVEELAITAVTAAELLHGVARLPDGQRKKALSTAVDALINEDFRMAVEPFDASAAVEYARVVVARDTGAVPSAWPVPRSQRSARAAAQPSPLARSRTSKPSGSA